jgi:hypothetical protein
LACALACAPVGAAAAMGAVSAAPATEAAPAPAPAPDIAAVLAALRIEDMRLATIGERLTVANAALCTEHVARTGLQIHDLSQYAPGARAEALRVFGFEAPIAVEGVVAGSAAAAAGVEANDAIVRVNGEVLEAGPADTGRAESTERAIAAEKRIADAGKSGVIHLDLLRHGKAVAVTLTPRTGCPSRFEVTVRDTYDARADGSIVQISTKMIEAIDNEDELAFVIAHELAHNLLRHRARLDDAGVSRGLFESLGPGVGFIRRSEIEADMLGIALAANAGYDVNAPARFWRWFGKAHFNSILLARTHPRWTLRAALLEREAAIIGPAAKPYIPPILAERDKPLTNDWRSLVEGL